MVIMLFIVVSVIYHCKIIIILVLLIVNRDNVSLGYYK